MKNPIEDMHKRFVVIKDEKGKTYNYSIKQIIPMQKWQDGKFLKVEDVEILLDRKNNIYFSVNMFLMGESWVKSFCVGSTKDQRIKTLPPIAKYKTKQMESAHYIETESMLRDLLLNSLRM